MWSAMKNWAGTYTYRSRRIHEPESVEELAGIVRASDRVRALGTRHSFNDLADTTGEHVSLARLAAPIRIDREAGTVTVGGGQRYGELCASLESAGLALANLASLPHISIAGSCATGTHGSGDRNANLAAAASAVELVRADGEIERIDQATPGDGLHGAVASLGALGVVTSVTLDIEPTFRVRQDVYEDLALSDLVGHFEDIVSAAYSVSIFTDWSGPSFHQVWLKTRLDAEGGPGPPPRELFGARLADRDLHPILGLSAAACTPQQGRPGPWHERLPHFRLDHTPSAGDELQSEYLVARADAVQALLAIEALRDRLSPLVQVSEIRTVAADELWLSPAYRRDSVAFHFTWKPHVDRVLDRLRDIEAVLEPFEPRPHWGKLFTIDAQVIRSRYERRLDFTSLARRLDPGGKFRNDFVDRYVFGGPGSET
jgi:xylitol oxidase